MWTFPENNWLLSNNRILIDYIARHPLVGGWSLSLPIFVAWEWIIMNHPYYNWNWPNKFVPIRPIKEKVKKHLISDGHFWYGGQAVIRPQDNCVQVSLQRVLSTDARKGCETAVPHEAAIHVSKKTRADDVDMDRIPTRIHRFTCRFAAYPSIFGFTCWLNLFPECAALVMALEPG